MQQETFIYFITIIVEMSLEYSPKPFFVGPLANKMHTHTVLFRQNLCFDKHLLSFLMRFLWPRGPELNLEFRNGSKQNDNGVWLILRSDLANETLPKNYFWH